MQVVITGVAGDLVVASCPHQHFDFDIGQAPGAAIGELDVFERVPVGAHAVGVEVAGDCDLIGGAVDFEDQAVADAAGRHVGAQHPGLELQHVALADVGVGWTVHTRIVRDGVLAFAPSEQIGVAAVTAHQIVVARATIERVVVAQPANAGVTLGAIQSVVAGPAQHGVGTNAAVQRIRAVAAVQAVVAHTAVQAVIACIP